MNAKVARGAIDWIARARALRPDVSDVVEGKLITTANVVMRHKHGPRDGRLLYQFGASSAQTVDTAVIAARRAYGDGRWSRVSAQHRSAVLERLAALLSDRIEEFSLLESLDTGKPISSALAVDIPMAVAAFRYAAAAGDKMASHVYGADPQSLSFQSRRAMGVVGAIIGWNFPLVLAAEKAAPCLAMGNSLILKPSELTSLSATRLAQLALDAGVPPGVFNVVHGGMETGAALARHSDVDMLTFTGSSRTGKQLLIASGESNMKRLLLECGGKAPNIVFSDAPDLTAVADAVLARAFWNQGQVCTASSRLLVHESIKEKLLDSVVKGASKLLPGDPLDANTTFGALVSAAHRDKVLGYIANGECDGAKVIYRGNSVPPNSEGFYLSPVIFDEVSIDHAIAREEIFGPVLSVLSFHDDDEAVRVANSTIYGLSAIVWTRDLARAHRVSQAIDAGWIVVNATATPTGGPGPGVLSIGGHKESGVGVEGGVEGLKAYTRESSIQYFV